jgi:hypothetical protein
MPSKLLFARFHFEPTIIVTPQEENLKVERDKQKILKIISFETDINLYLQKSKHKGLLNENILWQFGGIKSGEDYIYGKLGKVKVKKTNVVDTAHKDFKLGTQTEGEVCNFLFDIKNHIFAYESKKGVGPKAPYLIIEIIFNSYHNNEKIKFELLKNRNEILQKISELKIITSVKLNLCPTNPNSTSSSKKMDEFIKNFGAGKIYFELNAPENSTGINLKAADGIAQSGIRLAEEGYGSARIEGIKELEVLEENGKSNVKIEVIDSVGLPIKKEVDLSNNDDENIKILIRTTSDLMKMYNKTCTS